MSQQIRKEPTFGEQTTLNTESTHTATEAAEKPVQPKPTLSFSLHSNQSPGHTFTPVMKRPAEVAGELSTLEEKTMLNSAEKTAATATQQAGAAAHNIEKAAVAAVATTTAAAATLASKAQETVSNATAAFRPEPVLAHKPHAEQPKVEQPKVEQSTAGANSVERVVQNEPTAKKSHPIEKVPSKFRRLILVGLLALALILVFFLLKPKTPETVEALQEQGSSLPIEFRPVDEAEAKRAEEEAQALLKQQQEAELQAQQQAQVAQQAVQTAEQSANSANVSNASVAVNDTQTAPSASNNESVVAPKTAAVEKAAPTVAAKPVVVEPVKKPTTNGSVIYQPENNKTESAAKPAQPAVQKVEATKAAATQTAQPTVKKAEPAKPAAQPAAKAAEKPAVETAAPAVASSKTITVEKGVSLFQKFRDNGLGGNLSELNKMTKLNGETSRLSPGQKITVRLDANKRIVEMNIGSGKYIRQADGSYIYK